jgi:hypothetical protein
MTTAVVLAHGVGGRRDLPLPFGYVLFGGGLAVLVSFAVLVWLRPKSRLDGATAGIPLPGRLAALADAAGTRWALRVLGLLLTGFTAAAAVFGADDELNPTGSLVYVLFWVGLVPASLLLGPVVRLTSPLRTVHHLACAVLGRDPRQGARTLPAAVGYWPAGVSLLAFTWLELATPDPDSRTTLIVWFSTYAVVHLAAAAVYGSLWFDRCEGFEVYSTLTAHLAAVGRRSSDGRLVLRRPLSGLDSVRAAPGLAATVSVLFGSTAFDGAAASDAWADRAQSGALSPATANTLGLVVTVVLVSLAVTAALKLAGRVAGTPAGTADPAALFAHSLIPIAVGYTIAHYFSFLVFNGQQAFILASDPLGTGADLFGTAGGHVDYALVSVHVIAVVQVLGVVVGHVLATVAAHGRAVQVYPRRVAVLSQLPMLALMVAFTVGGLLLLFAA